MLLLLHTDIGLTQLENDVRLLVLFEDHNDIGLTQLLNPMRLELPFERVLLPAYLKLNDYRHSH